MRLFFIVYSLLLITPKVLSGAPLISLDTSHLFSNLTQKPISQKFQLVENYFFEEDASISSPYKEQCQWKTLFTLTLDKISPNQADFTLTLNNLNFSGREISSEQNIRYYEKLNLNAPPLKGTLSFQPQLCVSFQDAHCLEKLSSQLLNNPILKKHFLGDNPSLNLASTIILQVFKPYNSSFLSQAQNHLTEDSHQYDLSYEINLGNETNHVQGAYTIAKANPLKIQGSSFEQHQSNKSNTFSQFLLKTI